MQGTGRGYRKSPLTHDPAALRYALANSGLTQRQLAEKIKKSESLVSEMLRGTRNATPDVLKRIAGELNCPLVVIQAKLATLEESA